MCDLSELSDSSINKDDQHRVTKKRRRHGRMSEVRTKLNLSSHVMGQNCNCKMKCFDVVGEENRKTILRNFNLMLSRDIQDSYLCGLISVLPVARRRPRNLEGQASTAKQATYKYRVRGCAGVMNDYDVCRKAFLAIHGIGKKRVERLVRGLKITGISPKNMRGKHSNRPWKIPEERLDAVREHIKSFPSRNSHYGIRDTKKAYLAEDLNIKRMYGMFKTKYPTIQLSYEIYRSVFNNEFNISFGYPRTDTCSTCDEYKAKVAALEKEKANCGDFARAAQISDEIRRLSVGNRVHLTRADTFYARKRKARIRCKRSSVTEAICIDYGRNLPIRNIPANDAYYKRQLPLSLYVFNIHRLSCAESQFYLYTEVEGKKASDDVCSLLHDYFYNHLPMKIRDIQIFCDSCSGQNKNHTVFRVLHYLVHFEKRFDSIKVTFPIRGHSYMECDRNMGLVNQKARIETPEDWAYVFSTARENPSPFQVRLLHSSEEPFATSSAISDFIFAKWTVHLSQFYKKKFPTRPIREIVLDNNDRGIKFHCTYTGEWTDQEMISRTQKQLPKGQFFLPGHSYSTGSIPISKAKYDDLQHLAKFCGPKAQAFFQALPRE
ncbi:uncharacterized protein [Anabrus simplex]|uniref:uncharacterized protein isoform X2 n=1 Tax=Anabrus simplex TaxID=316456 RepID=UPI0035A2DE52